MNSVKMYNGEKQKMTYSRLSIYLKSVKHLLNSKEEQSENKPFNFNEGRDFHITIDKENGRVQPDDGNDIYEYVMTIGNDKPEVIPRQEIVLGSNELSLFQIGRRL
jgi:hypothetical protein